MKNIMLLETDKKAIDAITKKAPKDAFKHVFMLKRNLYTTDGRVALRIAMDDITLSDGAYEVLKTEKLGAGGVRLSMLAAPDVITPGFEAIYSSVERLPQKEQTSIVIDKDDVTLTRAAIRLYKETGNAYNIKYLRHLASYNGGWTVVAYKKDSSVVLEHDNTCAVILPFMLD